ncbi:lactococcin 972 family bacteriocin [Georgenia yuyongxinii]
MLAASIMIPTAASAAQEPELDTIDVTSDGGTIEPLWLAPGPITQYPAEGGTWEYGFWNVKVRSNYTVERCHGTTVRMDNREHRSANTAAGYPSRAELWAVNNPSADDRYFYRVC